MESNDPYIKLSRVRDDYGIDGRQGTVLKLSELDGFSTVQLTQLRAALADEVKDISYQIALEEKRLEKDARWMYGCKNSRKARVTFINRINELVGDALDPETAIRFAQVAKDVLGEDQYQAILGKAQHDDVFSAEDMG